MEKISTVMSAVFDNIERKISGGAPKLLSCFDYLNNSNRLEAERVRQFVDELLSRYPEGERTRLRDRLRSIDNISHQSAFFELVLHELIIRSGCRIVEVEPRIPETRKTPDFLVETASGEKFYLEATLATGISNLNASAQQRIDQAIKTIDSVHSSNFFISLSMKGTPAKMVTGKRLKRELRQWLDNLDYDDVVAAWGGDGVVASYVYEEHGVQFHFSPVPRQRSRGSIIPTRSIGIRMLDPMWVQPEVPIRDAVGSKATRYGELDLPYVVAVNAMGDYVDEEDAINALFGSSAVTILQTEAGIVYKPTRAPNGAWYGRGGAINTRVSAALLTEDLSPWSVGQRRPRLILNPWAQKTLPKVNFGIDVLRVEEEILQKYPGKDFRNLFDLPEGWPEDYGSSLTEFGFEAAKQQDTTGE
jgi:hypothetical protein